MNYWEFGHYNYLCLSPLFPCDFKWPNLLDFSLGHLCLFYGDSSNQTHHKWSSNISLYFHSTLTMWSHSSLSPLFSCSNCEVIWDFLKVPQRKNGYIGNCTSKVFLIIVLKTIFRQYILKYKKLFQVLLYIISLFYNF